MIKAKNHFSLSEPISLADQTWPEDTVPLTTVWVTTYMHGAFIRDCIEGILAQKTTFPVQVLVHDDASTDSTVEILREYEARYPQLIRVYYQKFNTYRLPNRLELRSEFFSWKRGKYMARCEGDDFWTHPLKLEKQVGFLEANGDYACCYHDCRIVDQDKRVLISSKMPPDSRRDYSQEDLVLGRTNILYLSLVHRNEPYESLPKQPGLVSGDNFLTSQIGLAGKGKYMEELFDAASYRKHGGGVWSNLNEGIRLQSKVTFYDFMSDFYRKRQPAVADYYARRSSQHLKKLKLKNADTVRTVAVFTPSFYPVECGMEIFIHNLCQSLQAQGLRVVLFAPQYPEREFIELETTYLLIRFRDHADLFAKFRESHQRLGFEVMLAQSAWVMSSFVRLVSRAFGIPFCCRTHGEDITIDETIGYGYRLDPQKNEVITRNIVSAKSMISISRKVHEEVLRIPGAPESHVIHNAVDTDFFAPGDSHYLHELLKIPKDRKIVLMVGRNVAKKCFHLGIEAFAALANECEKSCLVLCGKQGNGRDLSAVAKQHNLEDRFFHLQQVEYAKMPLVYQSASIFVFPSKSETFGNVTIEAMACGLPCVEFEYGCSYEKLREGVTGYTLEFGDSVGMTAAMKRLLDDDTLRRKFSAAAREHVAKNFSWTATAQKYHKVFESILGSQPRRPILIAANDPTRYNAPNVWLLRILPLLSERGFDPEVVFFTFSGQREFPLGEELTEQGIRVHYLPARTTEDNIVELIKVINRVRPDLFIPNLVVPAYYAAKWARNAGIRTIGILRSDDAFYHEIGDEFVWGSDEWRLDGLVCVSKFLTDQAIAHSQGKVIVMDCPSGAPVPEETAQAPKSGLRLVYCGRFVQEQKRILDVTDSLIQVLTKDQELSATLYGGGALETEVRQRVEASGVSKQLSLGGALHPKKLQSKIVEDHVFVLLSDYEGLSTALLEAMACGLVPVVLEMRSGVDGLIEDHVNGLIVKDRGSSFEEAIHRLKTEKGLWARLSKNARQTVINGFSSDLCADRWTQFLDRIRPQSLPAQIPLPSVEEMQLPPKRTNPLGIAREDHRKPTAEAAFTAPSLHPNNADLYWRRQSILNAIRSAAPLLSGTFLDVGCGIMPYKKMLTGAGSRIERYIGLDIETETDPAEVDLRWDGRTIPLEDDSIDSAMATEVLEHCPEPLVVLQEIRRVLKPGGVFFFTVPYIWPLHDAPYDFYRYTPFSLKRLLAEAGFADYEVRALSGWDASLAQMMGLWLKRAPMSNERRSAMAQKLWPLYQELVQTDQLPPDSEAGNTMATGWRGLAYKPAAKLPEEEIRMTDLPVIIVRSHAHNYSETFIEDHVNHISRRRILIYGWPLPRFDESGRSVLDAELEQQIAAALRANQPVSPELQRGYREGIARFIRQSGAGVALLESGLMGAMWYEACLQAQLPYVIHFHGVDAFGADILNNHGAVYRRMFAKAAAVVGVSKEMVAQLQALGADPARLVHGPYGVSVELDRLAAPEQAPPTFIAVGRFVDKKSPQRTLQAFEAIHKKVPAARLVMIGDGPLLPACRQWARQHNLDEAVTFAGVQSRKTVSRMLAGSRVFVQHSVCAENGDREGLPLAILEAGAHGLPVVATRHAGIPDAVRGGQDGFLVDEGDVLGMAKAMLKLAGDAALAGRMGRSFRERVCQYYSRAVAIQRLQTLLAGVIEHSEASPSPQSAGLESTPAESAAPSTPQSLESRMEGLQSANAAWALAQEASAAKQPELAFEAAELAVGLDRNCAPAYLFLGQQLAAKGAYEEAYLCFSEAARVGEIPVQAQQMLRAMEDNPELQTGSIQTYRDCVSADHYTRSGKPRRILVFTNLLPPQEMGGFGRSVWELCEGLIQRGHELCILTADVKELEQAPYPNYERVERHVERTLRLFGRWEDGAAVEMTDPQQIREIALSNVEVILKAVKRFRPDVCMAGNLDFVSGAMLDPILAKNIPIVHRLGNEAPGYPVEMLPRSELFCLAGCSHWVNAQLQQAGYHPAHFACLPPGSPLHEYYRLMPPRTDRLRICYAGLMMGYKGPHLILEALHLLKQLNIPFSCEFAGDFKGSKYKAQFEQMIRQWNLGPQVRVLGFCNRRELGAMFARSNVLVLPSIFEEPFGKVQVEAQAAGLAVVRTPVGGYRDMLEDEVNGLLFQRKDPQDLARQLYVLHNKPDFWQRLAARGQADAFRFTTRNSVQILEGLFEDLLDLAAP
ncbi:MAG: glycosyltransferase [Opitutales bacterium]